MGFLVTKSSLFYLLCWAPSLGSILTALLRSEVWLLCFLLIIPNLDPKSWLPRTWLVYRSNPRWREDWMGLLIMCLPISLPTQSLMSLTVIRCMILLFDALISTNSSLLRLPGLKVHETVRADSQSLKGKLYLISPTLFKRFKSYLNLHHQRNWLLGY